MVKIRRSTLVFILMALFFLMACGKTGSQGSNQGHPSLGSNQGTNGGGSERVDYSDGNHDFAIKKFSGPTLSIVSGSENRELEPIIADYAKEKKQNITIDYLGSLDIMRMIKSGKLDYDAVWPASSIWLNMGDRDAHILKHAQTISISPIVFGIRKSLAQDLGFVGQEVHIKDIMEAIGSGRLKFAMTSASQSNSGASAYLGFLTALAGKENEAITSEDLKNPKVQDQITQLLAGVNKSSGSSNWLVDLFLSTDQYDAMVNYETLIIQTNYALEKENRESLYVVYPVDAISFCDSPLAYVDDSHGNQDLEEVFLDFQAYLLSDEIQGKIEKTGRRSAYGGVEDENRSIFKKDWGLDLDKTLAPIRLPQASVIEEALNLYQVQFKKPSLTAYVLDYSGSMIGYGMEEMDKALRQVLIPENASKNLLLGTPKDRTYLVAFSDGIISLERAQGNSQDLRDLYDKSKQIRTQGGTALYEAVSDTLKLIKKDYGDHLADYSPSIVVLTDGMPNGPMDLASLEKNYKDLGLDIPIFSIKFGEASKDSLEPMADFSNGRVFDGDQDLVQAFRQVRGYN